MQEKKHLIIGCGSAALSALETIRSVNQEDEIKVVTAEKHPPYSPTALPYLLSGRIQESNLWMRQETYFKQLQVVFETGRRAVEIVPERKEVRFHDGSYEKYDRLLIATGSEPTIPPIKGLDEAGFLGFRTFDDYRSLVQRLEAKRNVTILGAGLVGMEVAMGLIEKGYDVNIVARGRILRVYFDAEAEAIIREIFLKQGATLVTGHQVGEVKAGLNKLEVELTNGESLRTDVVVTAMGVKPRTAFLNGSGIKTENGILVDRNMQTSVADVFAAGDVAEAPDFFTGKPGMNPIIPSAVSQGKIAGAAMVGEDASYYEGWIPMNVFNFFGNFAFSVGLSTVSRPEYEVFKEVDEEHRRFRKLVFQGDKLVGAMLANVDADPGTFHYLVRNQVKIGERKEALFEKPRDIGRWLMLENEK